MVKGGVEAGDLRHSGGSDAQARIAATLWGWCSGASGSSCDSRSNTASIDHDRVDECGAAMHDAMADGDETAVTADARPAAQKAPGAAPRG